MRVAKADLVPAGQNLLPAYRSFAELEAACAAVMGVVNGRVHRETNARPVDRLQIERPLLHRVRPDGFTAVFGVSRAVSWSCTVSWGNARYSVPHAYADTRVWVREDAGELVVTAIDAKGPIELCHHPLLTAGGVSVVDGHYPERRDPLQRPPRATKPGEAAFLRIGAGAAQWLGEAAGAGTRFIEKKMGDAVAFCSIYGTEAVDQALGVAAVAGRFAERDLPRCGRAARQGARAMPRFTRPGRRLRRRPGPSVAWQPQPRRRSRRVAGSGRNVASTCTA